MGTWSYSGLGKAKAVRERRWAPPSLCWPREKWDVTHLTHLQPYGHGHTSFFTTIFKGKDLFSVNLTRIFSYTHIPLAIFFRQAQHILNLQLLNTLLVWRMTKGYVLPVPRSSEVEVKKRGHETQNTETWIMISNWSQIANLVLSKTQHFIKLTFI